MRESTEESGIDPARIRPASPLPVYVEYGRVPARPVKNELAHFHLDIGFAFTAAAGTQVGRVQEQCRVVRRWTERANHGFLLVGAIPVRVCTGPGQLC